MDLALASLTLDDHPWQGRRVVSESERAFSDVVRAHEPVLLGLARKMCGNDADARDLVHDCYERALRAWDRYNDRGNLRSWLVAILNNLFIDRCRKARRDPKTEEIEAVEVAAPEPAVAPAWADVTPEQIARALDDLGGEFRRVYDLHVAGQSYDAIAAELGIAKATVGTRLVRARKKLKDALLRELGGNP